MLARTLGDLTDEQRRLIEQLMPAPGSSRSTTADQLSRLATSPKRIDPERRMSADLHLDYAHTLTKLCETRLGGDVMTFVDHGSRDLRRLDAERSVRAVGWSGAGLLTSGGASVVV